MKALMRVTRVHEDAELSSELPAYKVESTGWPGTGGTGDGGERGDAA